MSTAVLSRSAGCQRLLCAFTLATACSWTLQAEDVEQFTLSDGREMVGSYDEAKGQLSVLTPSGRIVADVAKELIVKRKPSTIPEFAAPVPPPTPVQPVVEAQEKAPVPAPPMPIKPRPAPPAKAPGEAQAKVAEAAPGGGDPRRKQMMDYMRQMTQLQQAAAAGDAAAAQQLQQLLQHFNALVTEQGAKPAGNGQRAP